MFSFKVKLKTWKRENDFSVVIVILKLNVCGNSAWTSSPLDGIGVRLTRVFFKYRETVDSCENREVELN